MSRVVHRLVSDTGGFTVVELLVTMTVGLLIAGASLTAFEAFTRGTVSNSRLTDAEDVGRRDMAKMVQILRNAGAPPLADGTTPITMTRTWDNDIVFVSTAWPGQSQTGSANHVERLCLDTASKTIMFDGLHAGITGPADPGPTCPSQAQGWEHRVLSRKVANTAALPLFRLGSAPVRSVAIQLRSDSGTSVRSRTLELNSGSTLRGTLAPNIAVGDINVQCNSDNSGKPLLSLAPGHGDMKLSAANAMTVGPAKLLLNSAVSSVTLTITDALGLQSSLVKPVSC